MLHKDYDRKCSVEKKITGRESQGVYHQVELFGGKPSVIKYNSDSEKAIRSSQNCLLSVGHYMTSASRLYTASNCRMTDD
jgi:hypothetical protein